ncbi:Citrinin biosynthesis transcriptional activator mrl3 [Hyphodiscus hymeniophilus]|uniref:Citrinin biosynthesis transcriptional activator mrl3 n=1 Tax=Hyphodiscus hymeniophilus TaxID=353542 RepID=A0A9P7B021_9HELO|nr:Citrinin biosynthesis transcriptional activator mrl3 [Hyphodiscus hymeniophilus]
MAESTPVSMSTPPPAPSSDARPRKRVSQACQPCGLKKIKCDGSSPKCTPCHMKGIDCSYGVSKRRARSRNPASPRSHIGSFLPPPSHHRDDSQRPLPQYSLPPINQIHERHKPTRHYSSISPELSTRFFQTYFNSIHPLWPILYKPLYASLDYGSPSDTMPPALVAAIYAIASCVEKSQQYAPNTVIQRFPEPRDFFEEALDLLQNGNGNQPLVNIFTPSITSCQVLAILVLQQHGVAEYPRAAVLCGFASSMAIDMRIHRASESVDSIQVEVRSRLWWNLFILEKMLSCEMGKPVLLRSEETDCPYPSLSEADEFELMSVYTRNPKESDQVRNPSIKLRTISVLHTSVKLAIIMERISREIYGLVARKTIRENQAAGESKRMDVWWELREWERDIETSPLKLDLDHLTSVPGIITNYVIMWHSTILIHRPFIARWQPHTDNPDSVSYNPLRICLQAAENICMILEKYFDRLPGLPCDMVFSVFTAASTLLYNSNHANGEVGVDVQRRLKLCIHWLQMLGKSWKSAGARQQLLSDMYDLPRHLQDSTKGQLLQSNPSTPFNQSTPRPEYLSASPSLPANGNFPRESSQSLEDWGFLREFGDSMDDFYALDVQLIGLLNGQGAESNGFV